MASEKTVVRRILLGCLCLCLIQSSTSSDVVTFLKTINTSENYLNKCLPQIIKQNFPCNAFINLIYSQVDVKNLIEFISRDECYSFIIRDFDNKEWNIWNGFYIIIASDVTELVSGLLEIRRDILWNPTAKFIVAVSNTTDLSLQEMFQQFLKYKIHKLLLISYTNDDALIYTYYPFIDNNCGDRIDEIINLGRCLETEKNDLIEFPNNHFNESRNCKLRAVMFIDNVLVHRINDTSYLPIVERHVLDSYAKHSNFTVDYEVLTVERNFGVISPNGTASGLLRYLQSNLADIGIGSTVIIRNRANVFDFIYGFNYASFQLYTSALGTEMWKKVYKEFDSTTYLIILIFYFLMIYVCIFFLKRSPKIQYSRVYLIMKLWGFFYLGNGTEPYPKTTRLRSVTLCWIWFTFFISSFYNSDMYSLITGHVQRVRQIEPNKLSSLPYKPCIPRLIHIFFHYAYNEDLPESFDPEACGPIEKALFTTANGDDLYTVQMKPSYTQREAQFIDKNGNRKLDAWDYGSDILLGFYIDKGLPYKQGLQKHAQYMFQTGLVQHYKELVEPTQRVDRRKKNISEPFVLEDFRVHFAVLLLGSILSTLTFIGEILYHRKKNLTVLGSKKPFISTGIISLN